MIKKKIAELRGVPLKDQLKIYQAAGAPNLKGLKQSSLVGPVKQGLLEAVDLYHAKQWVIEGDSLAESEISSSGEEFDFNGGDGTEDGVDDEGDWETEPE